MMYVSFLFILLIFPISGILSQKISCRNLQNASVDWYIIYKIPDINKNPDKLIQDGLGILYMDESTKGQWVKVGVGVNSPNQSLGFTLQQVYNSKQKSVKDTFHILYNDEWPNRVVKEAPATLGHTKGSMLFDKKTGFWLIHSTPKFPPPDQYEYPVSGTRFGQSVLCITFAYSSLSTIAQQLLYNQPAIYDSALSSEMVSQIPTLQRVINGQWQKTAPFNNMEELQSLNGKKFKSYAKHKKWNKELYSDFVAPSLERSLYTETWQNGRGDIGSDCSTQYKVNNVENLQLQSGIAFHDNKDHSKWAVTTDASTICIGDINRQKGQFKRSGGTVCFNDEKVGKTFKNSIAQVQDCPVKES